MSHMPRTRCLELDGAEDLGTLRASVRSKAKGLPRWEPAPDQVERSVMKLVLTLVDFIRQLLERQTLRRMEQATLTDEEIEAIGVALQRLEKTIHDLAAQFGLSSDDLQLELGPLGRLI